MDAIANMDNKKKGIPELQRSDCMQVVKILQEIRTNLFTESQDDCTRRVSFIGQNNVPTWNGFVGDYEAVINLYPTHPSRGQQASLKAKKDGLPSEEMMYQWAADDCVSIARGTDPVKDNLWNYQLPSSLPDLRL